MVVLIKGAGDLASGIALRLYRAGFKIVMTECAIPTTVRRTVAFSRAVYESTASVEDIKGVLCKNDGEIYSALSSGFIAVVVDEKCEIIKSLRPDVVVDAIIAKKNTGTAITDAPCVIGVGPGFTAGQDCFAAVETQRGHNLGRALYLGSPAENTGIPGIVGGFTSERLLRSRDCGIFKPYCKIGDVVEKGQAVAISGGEEIIALIGGVVRGMLQPGVYVEKGMKCGDVDPRGNTDYCKTVSDKALAIGGGVLEAIMCFKASST